MQQSQQNSAWWLAAASWKRDHWTHISGGRARRPVSEARAFLRPRRFDVVILPDLEPAAVGSRSTDRRRPRRRTLLATDACCSVNVRA